MALFALLTDITPSRATIRALSSGRDDLTDIPGTDGPDRIDVGAGADLDRARSAGGAQ